MLVDNGKALSDPAHRTGHDARDVFVKIPGKLGAGSCDGVLTVVSSFIQISNRHLQDG